MSAKGFEVVDRNHLKSILMENKLSFSGLVNPDTIKKIGQISGVDALVTGSVIPFGDNIRVTCKVIATDTARIITADKTELAKTKAIDELLSKGIQAADSKVSSTEPAKQSPGATKTAVSDKSSVRPIEIDNFVFELKEASISGREVSVVVEALNKSKSRLLLYQSYPQIVDDFGNTYGAPGGTKVSVVCGGTSKNALSNRKGPPKRKARCSDRVETMEKFIETITFEDVSAHISKIQSFKTSVQIDSGKYYDLEFFDIPLKKEE